jgi:hypothetical protein
MLKIVYQVKRRRNNQGKKGNKKRSERGSLLFHGIQKEKANRQKMPAE